jgi:hypothetical protein
MTINYSELTIGDKSPIWKRKTSFMEWNRFAAANDEFYLVHMDDQVAIKAENSEGAFGMGHMRFSYLHNAIRDWLGDEIEVKELLCRYTAINQKDDELSAELIVTEKFVNTDNENMLKLSVDVYRKDRISTTPGTALIKFPN